MKVLVVGSGAREHALVRALLADPGVSEVHAAPGNAGIAADVPTHQLDAADPAAVAALATGLAVDLVVVGPEGPLVAGAADAVRAARIACFGPSAAAARLEGSKAFAKDVMTAAGVPTARARLCVTTTDCEDAFDDFGAPYVVKDDGLAAGKGVVVTADWQAAGEHAAACLAKPGGRVVIEEYLPGPEVSLFAVTDGTVVVPLQPAQDFKRALDGDLGPNTGGMGAYSPLDWVPAGLVDEVVATVVQPTVDELRRRGTPFVGLVYAGLALTASGVRVIEFNARFGDPETQVVLARLRTPLGGLLYAAATGTLAVHPPLEWSDDAAVCVVVAAAGYPAAPRTGDPIGGLAAATEISGATVLHAGTATVGDRTCSAGGRVLTVVGTGAGLAKAREAAYTAVDRIDLAGSHHRTDIARSAQLGEVRLP
ncbi:MAG TPA: phosphoribosylamine--glycine ligase [Candidatus Nanopelagicales bacterium]|nr:phosphoribosylamine--glycine ligase [Candidatus Nanopelagicales bacterium]